MLGIISGTVLLHDLGFSNNPHGLLPQRSMKIPPYPPLAKGGWGDFHINEFGSAVLMLSDAIAFLPRHGRDPQHYILPHLINHRANLKALRDAGVTEVIGINSTGALKKEIKPGTIVIPDDFIMLAPCPSIHENKAVHITPGLDTAIRRRCLEAARACGIDAMDGGTYWQTAGPRLETKAEIRMMAGFADIVGMTMASEAIVSKELGLSYAAICSVDNYAHGIDENELTMEEISTHARQSGKTITRILAAYMGE